MTSRFPHAFLEKLAPRLPVSAARVSAALLSACFLLSALSGCVEKEKHRSKASRELQKTILLTAPAKPEHPLEFQFGNKVRLLGYDINRGSVREGEPFKVTWYWKVIAPLDEGYKIFTHLADEKKEGRVNLDAARVLREAYPESQWKAGDLLRDEQEVVIPNGWGSKTATLLLGFWKDDQRLPVSKGPSDQNRAEALTVSVSRATKEGSVVPRLIARRVTKAITIDGKLDEADWLATQPTDDFVNTMTGADAAFQASVRVLYDAEHLYLGYVVEDDYLRSTFEKDDDHLWEQDVIEVMVDPNGDGKSYFEAQVAPTGRIFDTRYDTRRLPRPFGHMAWSSQMQAAVSTRGTVNDDEGDEGYTVELLIPWTAFATGPDPASPPKASETWRMNFFVMDVREKGMRAAGWSPPLVGDFHTLGRFGRVIFPLAANPADERPGTRAADPAATPAGPQPVLIAPDKIKE